MSQALGRWNPQMEVVTLASGALTNATFAVAGLKMADILVCVEHLAGGSSHALKTVLFTGGAAVTAGDCVRAADGEMQIPSVATNADTLRIRYIDVSAGSEA